VPSAQVKKAATKAGFTERTLARARVQLCPRTQIRRRRHRLLDYLTYSPRNRA
jgi:hypothetical protein